MEKHSRISHHSTQETPRKSFFARLWGPRVKTTSLFLVVFALSLILIARIDHSYRIGTFKVLGDRAELPFIGADQYQGMHTWDVNEADVFEYFSQANPEYEIVSVSVEYPSIVSVEVKQHIPAAYLDVSDGYVLLSNSGVILSKSHDEPEQDHPRIAFYQQVPYNAFERGTKIGYKEIQDSLYFLDTVESARLKVNRIDISSFYMLGLYTDGGTFLFTSEKDPELQKYQFEQSLKQVSIEGITFDTLDFRFDKPIVRL